MHMNSLTPMQISGTPRSFLNFGSPLPDIDSRCCDWWGSGQSTTPLRVGLVSVSILVSFGEHDASLLVVARTAPASEDGVQLGGVKRPRVLTAREPSETSGAIKEPRPRQAATRLADGQRGDERAVRRCVLLHQALRGFRHPMDGMGWQYLESVRQLPVGNEDSALRNAFEKCTRACMRRHPIVRSESSSLSAAKVTRLASRLLVSKYPPALTRVPRDATAIVLIFFFPER